MTPTNQEHHPQNDPPPGPVVLQLVGADPEVDAMALVNAMALHDDLETISGRRVLLIVKDPPQRWSTSTRWRRPAPQRAR